MVAFTSYGLFWWWFAFLQVDHRSRLAQSAAPVAAGTVLLLAWGVFTFLLWIVTFRFSKAVWSIFLLLWITFFFLGLGRLRLHDRPASAAAAIGGHLGLLTGIDALLVAFIEVLNATAGPHRHPSRQTRSV